MSKCHTRQSALVSLDLPHHPIIPIDLVVVDKALTPKQVLSGSAISTPYHQTIFYTVTNGSAVKTNLLTPYSILCQCVATR